MIQCDGYGAYRTFARKHTGGEVTLAGCWAHARRKFHDALEAAGKGTEARVQAAWILRQIQHLYAIERDLRTGLRSRRLRLGPIDVSLRTGFENQSENRIDYTKDVVSLTFAADIFPTDRMTLSLGPGVSRSFVECPSLATNTSESDPDLLKCIASLQEDNQNR